MDGIFDLVTILNGVALIHLLRRQKLTPPAFDEAIRSQTPTVEEAKIVDMDSPHVVDMEVPHIRRME